MGHIGPEVVVDPTAFVHESAQIHGKVTIGPGASIWPNVVMRAELFEIVIGARSNIQDFVMIHVGFDSPTIVGDDCSITHHVTLHGCEVGDRVLVGINATLMDGCRVGSNSIVAGHAIVSEGSEFGDNSIIAGVPAKQVAERDCGEANLTNARFYHRNGQNYANGIERFSPADIRYMKTGE